MNDRLRLRISSLALVVVITGGAGCGESPTTPAPPPPSPLALTGFEPVTGNIHGGTVVLIDGSGFDSGTRVSIGGVQVNHTLVRSTQLLATAPSHPTGSVAIVVTNAKGESVTASAMFTYAAAALRSFEDAATGFRTSELRDGQDQIVRLDQDGFLVFPDGPALPGFRADERYISVPSGCQCALEVRFGRDQGQQRAYLTGEYGHYNPATLVNLNVLNGSLVVTPTGIYPPGTLMLSGTITELTESGESPVDRAVVELPMFGAYRAAQTNDLGAYELRGLIAGSVSVTISKPGYEAVTPVINLEGNRRLDVRLRRR